MCVHVGNELQHMWCHCHEGMGGEVAEEDYCLSTNSDVGQEMKTTPHYLLHIWYICRAVSVCWLTGVWGG